MATSKSLLEEMLDYWSYTRHGVIAEVKNLPEKDFGFRPTSESRSVVELVQHIIESGLMMAGELTRPDGNFRRKSFSKFIQEYAGHVARVRSKARLIELLRRSHADGEKKFRQAGELLMFQFITRFDGLKGSRIVWMHHGIAHEEYHRGQLALHARLMGRVPALTKLIRGE